MREYNLCVRTQHVKWVLCVCVCTHTLTNTNKHAQSVLMCHKMFHNPLVWLWQGVRVCCVYAVCML